MSPLRNVPIDEDSEPTYARGLGHLSCSLGAVVVLYHPNWAQTQFQLEALKDQVAHIVLVDNTPDSQAPALRLPDSVTYLPMGENTGIAHAQNRGVQECERNDLVRFIVFFDQDSEIPDDLIATLLQAYFELTELGHLVAAIGPRPFDTHRKLAHVPLFSIRQRVSSHHSRVSHLLSSGTLLPLDAFTSIGPFDESLFIDSVDQEWCWRAAERGWSCFVDESLVLPHRMGIGSATLFGLSVTVSAPIRLYYQFRNSLRLMLHYSLVRVPRAWIAKRSLALPAKFVVNALLFPNRRARLLCMALGIRDGILNRQGVAPPQISGTAGTG